MSTQEEQLRPQANQGQVEPKLPQNHEEKESKGLTPEEQMALYEKALKEDDWGHQPC